MQKCRAKEVKEFFEKAVLRRILLGFKSKLPMPKKVGALSQT